MRKSGLVWLLCRSAWTDANSYLRPTNDLLTEQTNNAMNSPTNLTNIATAEITLNNTRIETHRSLTCVLIANNIMAKLTNESNYQTYIPSTGDSQFTWIRRWLPLRLSKRQSVSARTVFSELHLLRQLHSKDYWYSWVQTIYKPSILLCGLSFELPEIAVNLIGQEYCFFTFTHFLPLLFDKFTNIARRSMTKFLQQNIAMPIPWEKNRYIFLAGQ